MVAATSGLAFGRQSAAEESVADLLMQRSWSGWSGTMPRCAWEYAWLALLM
jgi:hypothetical protein